jgi:tripartite-type tricarboxylate transporter receptor subunit TctC
MEGMTMKKGVTLALILVVAGAFAAQAAEYPARDITNVVVWAAGGGTDVCNRIVSAEMQKVLNVRINVTNRTGGVGGSIGMLHVLGQPADGYTLAGISESVVTAGVQGGWDKTMDVWYPFIIGGSPDLVSVTPDSPYKTIQDLIEAAKKAPNTIKISASAAGSPDSRLLKKAHLRRCPASPLAATYLQYASLGLQRAALHLGPF